MNRKPSWGKLYLFSGLALVLLFQIPPTDKSSLILWMLVMYGGLALWLRSNQSAIDGQSGRVSRQPWLPVEEFYDQDRIQLQQCGSANNTYEEIR